MFILSTTWGYLNASVSLYIHNSGTTSNTKDVRRISEDVRMTSTGCRDKDSKKIKIYLEDVQRMSKGFPKDVLRMSKGHPEGSKGDLQRKDWGCIIMHTSA